VTTETFPAIGHVYEARFGDLAFHLQFDADGGTNFAKAEAVRYRAMGIRPDVFMVTWTEADGTTVTHVEDFENGIVHTNITRPDLSFLNLSGSWTRLT